MKTRLWDNNISVVLLGKVVESCTLDDTPPHSLKDSIVSAKVKTMEGRGIEVRFLTRSISGVKGCVGAQGWGLG